MHLKLLANVTTTPRTRAFIHGDDTSDKKLPISA